uniref:ParA family protein n=1 Tax=candidate division CPR3 bacterium TaxID=2268181 RepID=A0A7C5UT77_UNCC3
MSKGLKKEGRMGRRGISICVVDQKGGVGKSTVSANLACALSLEEDKHVLLVDMDPQAALSTAFGFNPDELEKTIYDVFFNSASIESLLLHREDINNVYLLPSNLQLAEGEVRLIGEMGREYFLKRAIEPIKDNYDYIIIDSPPSLSVLTTNALVAADYVLIPVAPDVLSLRGMENLIEYVIKVKRVINPVLEILGIIINMFDRRTLHAKEAKQVLLEEFGEQIRIFKTDIMYTTKVKDSYGAKKPVVLYDPSSEVAKQYMALTKEVEDALG